MRRLAIILGLALSTPAQAADDWDELEIAWQAANIADFALTEHCLRKDICHEANPIIGRNPSTEKLLAIKTATGVAHYVISRYIADRDPKAARTFQIITLAFQGSVVIANLRFAF